MANFAGMQKQFDESQMGVYKFNILGCLLQTKNIPTVIVCSVYCMLYSTSTYHLECLLTDTLKLFGDIHKKVESIVTMTYLSFSFTILLVLGIYGYKLRFKLNLKCACSPEKYKDYLQNCDQLTSKLQGLPS